MGPDPWNIGTLHKPAIWAFYILSNYVGVWFCLVLIYSVHTNVKRMHSDLYIASLASGCIMMSSTCGTQCLLNVIAGRFFGEDIACQFEAIAHVSSILVQFFSVTCMTVTFSQSIVKQKEFREKRIKQSIVLIWVICLLVTGLASFVSPIYLMSAGTYCFFGFSSFAIAGWLVPGLVIALVTMFWYHIVVVRHFTSSLAQTAAYSASAKKAGGQEQKGNAPRYKMATEEDVWKKQFTWRSTRFILILLLGWGFAAVTTIDELIAGRAPEWLVTAVGTGGVSFSWAVPVLYLFLCEHHRICMMRCFGWLLIPCKGRSWYLAQSQPQPPRIQLSLIPRNQKRAVQTPSTPSIIAHTSSVTSVVISAHASEPDIYVATNLFSSSQEPTTAAVATEEKDSANSQDGLVPCSRTSQQQDSVLPCTYNTRPSQQEELDN